jgi:hypothetical protein
LGVFITIFVRRLMYPATSKTHVRGPLAVIHARSEPVPESLRFVTLMIDAFAGVAPLPEPATVVVPKPAAPGNTGKLELCAAAEEPREEKVRTIAMSLNAIDK